MKKQPSRLSDHTFVNGKFITPFNTIAGMSEMSNEKSWTTGRLPEYLWIGLILKKYGRDIGLQHLCTIAHNLHRLAPSLRIPRMSSILSLEVNVQDEFFDSVANIIEPETFAPLTLFCTYTNTPIFNKHFFSTLSIEVRQEILIKSMRDLMDHQSYESTDIRFVVLYFGLLSGVIVMPKEHIDLIMQYPRLSHSDDTMRMIRPTVRSSEMMLLEMENIDNYYLDSFWRCISEMTECKIFSVNFPKEEKDISKYTEVVHEIFVYLSDLYSTVQPLNEKMTVIIGLATYSYKRFQELCDYRLFNTIAGRSIVRVMIESYIMIKYLVANENEHDNIWKDYQLYGLGLYKLVLARHREHPERELSHFDSEYIDLLINEFRSEEFLNMDTKYFDKLNIRLKAESVGEKELFGLYYDYDSSFEHGLWGAVRESALLKCDNPAHQYHCIPDINGQQNLKSVLPDCVMVLNKTITFLREIYGIPDALYKEVINFEKESIAPENSGTPEGIS